MPSTTGLSFELSPSRRDPARSCFESTEGGHLRHLFICREYPPAAYPPGGIGTYVRRIAGLLAEAGETVHVIGQRWIGAPQAREEMEGGRLTLHRVALSEPAAGPDPVSKAAGQLTRALLESEFPAQAFSWQAALLAERLIESEGIDVVEAQEWEAPLYYLQLRRALGLGPTRRPPCVVHIHSTSEKIFEANGWETAVADYRPAVTMEEFSITAADAIICPSRYVADEASSRYRISPEAMNVIPYPLGDLPGLERSAHTWSSGSFCHIGRLEPRKGVLELADAFSLMAAEHPDLQIEFVGADTPLRATGGRTVGDGIRARLPRPLRRRLFFHGSLDRSGVTRALSRARAAIVSSRWDNFPYACIEAMSSGLPVVASPNGGMRELVVDGVSGWIADDGTPAALAQALRRAAAASAAELERMGRAAAERVRLVCDNRKIVRRHLEMKRLSEPKAPHSRMTPSGGRPRMAVVVTRPSSQSRLDGCLSSIRAQTEPTTSVRIVGEGGTEGAGLALAMEAIKDDPFLTALVFVDSRLRLNPGFLSICAAIFSQDDRSALVSGWTHQSEPGDRVLIQPCPPIPHLGRNGEVAPCIAVRVGPFTEAVRKAGERAGATSLRGLCDSVMQAGWSGVTYPAVIGSITLDKGDPAATPETPRYSLMALALRRLDMPLLQWIRACSPEERWELLRRGVRNPLRAIAGLAERLIDARVRSAPPTGSTAHALGQPAPDSAGLNGPRGDRPPMVSVVMAAFNASDFIEEACRSVLNQSYTPLELIVVDDGSTDDTNAIVRELAAADPRVRLIHQQNLGVAAARNRAIAAASGEFIAPLDADDLWDPTKIERQVRRMLECGPGTGLVYCWWAWIDAKGIVLDRSPRWRVEGRVLRELVEVNFTGNASVPLYRRSFIEESGGYDVTLRDHNAQGCEDWDLVIRIAEKYALAVVPAVLVGYRRTSGSMSALCDIMWRSRVRVMASLAERQPSLSRRVLRRSGGQFALHLAGVSFWSGNYVQAVRWALRMRPWTLGGAVAPHVARLLARRVLGLRRPTVILAGGDGRFEEANLPEPLIPYDRICERRWQADAGRG